MPEDNCRPRHHLKQIKDRYPDACAQLDNLRSDRKALGVWPEWCYLPMAGWYLLVSAKREDRLKESSSLDMPIMAALGTWRTTKGIYRFDQTLHDEIIATPVSGDLPHEILFRMPEWCVYIEAKGKFLDGAMYGFFAHLDYDIKLGRNELKFVVDTDSGLMPIGIHLGSGSLSDSVNSMLDDLSLYAEGPSDVAGMQNLRERSKSIASAVEPLVALLLYLCTENAEFGNGLIPTKPSPKRTKRGHRTFPPCDPKTWEVGFRLGSALRKARSAASEDQGGTHAGPVPHIRRAHWHGFWTGAVDSPARTLKLKWLPPIAVNLESPDSLISTIRPMKNK